MVPEISYWKVLTRRKQLQQEDTDAENKLNRVLGLYDLTALGIGATLGAGVYVLAGQIAKDQAGPSVMLSFAIAAFASLLAGICYAEFGARVPKAGSAYIYSYVCIGEFAAFVIGWNLILEYMIGTASVCRGISLYFDTIINNTLKNTFAEVAPMNVSFLGSYFDFFSCGLVIIFGVALAFGVETSAIVNNFCTCMNIFILLFVIIAGALKANFSNWTIDIDAINKTDIPPDTDVGVGGFFPFGYMGTLKGAATCFFGFVGFDSIATTGEEVQNPRKNIPQSILLSLLVIFLCYFGVSTVITLMIPYYMQDANAPLPSAFRAVGWNFAMWIVSVGGLIGLLASLFGALFPLSRVMYSMAQDGLLFKVFGRLHHKYRVPVVGSIISALITAVIAGLFDLAQLVSLLSIGTLLAYSVVAISIIILRYMDNTDTFAKTQSDDNKGYTSGEQTESDIENHYSSTNTYTVSETSLLTSKKDRITFKRVLMQLFNCYREHTPNELSTRIVGCLIFVFCILSAGIGLIVMQSYDALINNRNWALMLMLVLCACTVMVLLCICLQPRELPAGGFTVPFVPLVPAMSIFINIYLMLQLDAMTWIRFAVWMAIGIPMYLACWCMYDIKNPANRHPNRIEFEKLLKLSSRWYESNSQEFFEKNKKHSVKLPADVMDLRYSNGNSCYIDKSPAWTNRTGECTEVKDAIMETDTSEEEKSVIALLDNVLQTMEDDNLQIFERKASIESEMVPSVMRSTTVATVHRACTNESYKNFIRTSNCRRNCDLETYEEKQKIAQQLVEEILNSPEVLLAMQKHTKNNSKADSRYNNIILNENAMDNFNLSKAKSEKTMKLLNRAEPFEPVTAKSAKSCDNSLCSESFRNKLNMLIGEAAEQKPKPKNPTHHELKAARSEPDVRNSVLQTKEDIKVEYKEYAPNIVNQNQLPIPKPPKFDPVLYKTITSLSRPKEQINLEYILKQDSRDRKCKKMHSSEVMESQNNELPFKQKLEAILKRTLFHNIQTASSH